MCGSGVLLFENKLTQTAKNCLGQYYPSVYPVIKRVVRDVNEGKLIPD